MTGLEQSLELRQHGKRLMKLLDQVVQTIDNYDRLWDILIKLGKNHFSKLFLVADRMLIRFVFYTISISKRQAGDEKFIVVVSGE